MNGPNSTDFLAHICLFSGFVNELSLHLCIAIYFISKEVYIPYAHVLVHMALKAVDICKHIFV